MKESTLIGEIEKDIHSTWEESQIIAQHITSICFCWVEHLQQIFIINELMYSENGIKELTFTNNEINELKYSNRQKYLSLLRSMRHTKQFSGSFYHKNGQLIRTIKLYDVPIVSHNKLCLYYNRSNQTTTFFNYSKILRFDKNFVFEEIKKSYEGVVKCIDGEHIYTLQYLYCNMAHDGHLVIKKMRLFIYDLEFNILRKIDFLTSLDDYYGLCEIILIQPSVFIIKKAYEYLFFDKNNFSFIGTLKDVLPEYTDIYAAHDDLCLVEQNNTLMLQKIDAKNNKIDDKMFYCQLNSLYKEPHLYSNPYLLPCGNSACLDCIHNDYNIYKGTFKCNFDSCHQEHKLELLWWKTDVRELIRILLDFGNKLVQTFGKLIIDLKLKFYLNIFY